MRTIISILAVFFVALTCNAQSIKAVKIFEKDNFQTGKESLVITFIGHASLMIEAGNRIIYVDPVMKEADFSTFPKGDIILVTHEHVDHLDKKALDLITKPSTKTIVSQSCKGLVDMALVFVNGQVESFGDIKIEAVPAYNIVHKRSDGIAYHPKGNGNGYIINYGGKRIYVGGDTENIPEMAKLKQIDIAFLPMNLPYTMTPDMVADGAKSFMPSILYPYHLGETNPQLLVDLLKGTKIEVRVRKMK